MGLSHLLKEFRHLPAGASERLIVTGLLLLSFLWMIVEQVLQSGKMDEFHRQVQYLAFPMSLVCIFAIGFFRAEGLFMGTDSRDLFVVLLFSYAAGWTIAWKKYA
jgi:hypothetical protein